MSEVHIGQDLIWNTILLQADAYLKVKVAKKKGGMIMIGEGVVLVGGHCIALRCIVGGDCVALHCIVGGIACQNWVRRK